MKVKDGYSVCLGRENHKYKRKTTKIRKVGKNGKIDLSLFVND